MADIVKVIKELERIYEEEHKRQVYADAIELLKEQETVEHACEILRSNGWTETEPICSECDAVHVVLCKDCKHWQRNTEVKNFGYCYLSSKVRSEDWFCADGE